MIEACEAIYSKTVSGTPTSPKGSEPAAKGGEFTGLRWRLRPASGGENSGLRTLLAFLGITILLRPRYSKIMQAHHDIWFLLEVHWADDEQVVLEKAQALVIYCRPVGQARIFAKHGAYPRITRVRLEKPAACSADAAAVTLHGLAMSVIMFASAIPPASRHGRSVWWPFCDAARPTDRCSCAGIAAPNHYAADLHHWKHVVSFGGDGIGFYGIHFIALLADLGYRDVRDSRTRASVASVEGEAMTWEAVLVGERQPACDIWIATDADETGFS